MEERFWIVGITDGLASLRAFGKLPHLRARSPRALTSPSKASSEAGSLIAKSRSAGKDDLTQRVWEIRVDTILKLDRTVRRDESGDNSAAEPQ